MNPNQTQHIKDKFSSKLKSLPKYQNGWAVVLLIYFFVLIGFSLYITSTIWSPVTNQPGNKTNSTEFSPSNQTILKKYANVNKSEPIVLSETHRTINNSKGIESTTNTTYFIRDKNLTKTVTSTLFNESSLQREVRLIDLSILFGILGASLHGLTSFATWFGQHKLRKSYFIWYITKPLIGGALALIVYSTLRATLLSSFNGAGVALSSQVFVNDYGVAGISALVGLMTVQMTQKLRDVFDTIFGIDKGSDKGDIVDIDNNITVIPTELQVKINEDSGLAVSIKDDDDNVVENVPVSFGIIDLKTISSTDNGAKFTDKNGMTFFKVHGVKAGKTRIIINSEIYKKIYYSSIEVTVFDDNSISQPTNGKGKDDTKPPEVKKIEPIASSEDSNAIKGKDDTKPPEVKKIEPIASSEDSNAIKGKDDTKPPE
jgi:hypothetical protein